ncbi:UDP-glucose 4-epimerase [Sodalis glossinidius str. 'morsitans']|uniref:UDP-glucose 4-epimerase n=1 Tax=Sodalis glossinidius (strain morsitans) TaxID=343509 RepID=A0A193QP64_SODGM|nr:NAD(P)-dependent oxidoreductase [Sodalis glossinidius]CRL46740.1 UDP-glucose 4-epimerase [Sodalis glossinidius str. 'morsitans']
MERILVTGGAGYIGTHLVRQLLSQGHFVRVLDNGTFGLSGLRPFYGLNRFEMQKGDIQITAHLRKSISTIDKIIHLAGIVGNPACSFDKDFCHEVNVVATRRIFDEAARGNVKNIVFASSCSVYGYGDDIFTEDSRLNPVDYYSETKVKGEAIAQAYKDDLVVTLCRFSTVFGAFTENAI